MTFFNKTFKAPSQQFAIFDPSYPFIHVPPTNLDGIYKEINKQVQRAIENKGTCDQK